MRMFVLLSALFLHLASLAQLPQHLYTAEQITGEKQFKSVPKEQDAFVVGELLRYKIRYGILRAGEAELRVSRRVERHGRTLLHMVGTGNNGNGRCLFQDPRSLRKLYRCIHSSAVSSFGMWTREATSSKDIFTLIQRPEPPGTIWTVAIRFTHCPKAFRISSPPFTTPEQWRPKISKRYDRSRSIFSLIMRSFTSTCNSSGGNVRTRFGKLGCLKLMPVVQSGRVFKKKKE